ncbi:MAG: site-2 protease family protein [Clostridia bacterium]|nr:site-2 protease family protein [Clostridia bacterium]
MFRYILGGGDMLSWVVSILLSLPVVLLSLSLHETAHGYIAYKLGDPTARNLGRLTLNPLKHLNPVGFLCMLLVGFGWANPVPVNSRYFKKPRRDMALTALAGPVSNLLLAIIFLLLLRFVGYGVLARIPASSEFAFNMIYFTLLFFYYGVYMNVTLAVFNLLPVPPLDGSRLLFYFLPPKWYFKIAPYERYITLAVLLLLLLGPLSEFIGWVTTLILRLLFTLVGMPGFLL